MDDKFAKDLLKKTQEDFEKIAVEFSLTREKQWPEFSLFRKFIKEGDRILDEGCGNGRALEMMKDLKVEYIGIDFSEKLLEIARKKYPDFKFVKGNIVNLPFPDNYFDIVFSIAVLHHIPSEELREKMISEVKRVLKPRGKFILSVWDFRSNKRLVFLILKYSFLKIMGRSKLDFGDVFVPWGREVNRYYHFFTEKEILKLIKEHNFKILKKGVSRNKRGKRRNIFIIARK